MKNIVLVGFMGTGKTTIGVLLSQKLKKKYVSTDDIIEEKESRGINDIFEQDGEKYFRSVEKKVITDIALENDLVIDTGGGVVLDRENMEALSRNGIVICLLADVSTIYERVKDEIHRPLLKVKDPKSVIQLMLEERNAFYAQADYFVDTNSDDVDKITDKIVVIANNLGAGEDFTCQIGLDKSAWSTIVDNVFENIDLPIFITGEDGKIDFINKCFLKNFSDDARPDNNVDWIESVIEESSREMALNAYENIKKRNNPSRVQFSVEDKHGKIIPFFFLTGALLSEKKLQHLFIGHTEKGMEDIVCIDGPTSISEFVEMFFSASVNDEAFTASHSLRVNYFTVFLAEKLGFEGEDLEVIKNAALLHDIGKLAIDSSILLKKGRLTVEEYDIIKTHPSLGVEMLKPFPFFRKIIPIIGSHHENYDGTGYPNGLKGEEISRQARIIAVADIYEALTADRPYRNSFPKEEAIRILRSEKGAKLDPQITDIFIGMVRKGHFENYKKDYYWVKKPRRTGE